MLGEGEGKEEESRSRSRSERGDQDHSGFTGLTCDATRAGERAEKQELSLWLLSSEADGREENDM